MMAGSIPLRYNRSFRFSVRPLVTTGGAWVPPTSFTTRAISVAKWIGAPSRSPAAKPIDEALSLSLILASVLASPSTDDCRELPCVRMDWAAPTPTSRKLTNKKLKIRNANLMLHPSNKGFYNILRPATADRIQIGLTLRREICSLRGLFKATGGDE